MNWKGEKAGKSAKHKWLDSNFGKPTICESPQCEGKGRVFEWCIKKGRAYSHNREDYFRLCRSCHRKLDKIYPPNQTGKHWKLSKETRRKLSIAKLGNQNAKKH